MRSPNYIPELDLVAVAPDASFGYGWVLSTHIGRPVLGHGGRFPGFTRCVVRYVPDGFFVALLRNVGQTATCDLARDVTRLLPHHAAPG